MSEPVPTDPRSDMCGDSEIEICFQFGYTPVVRENPPGTPTKVQFRKLLVMFNSFIIVLREGFESFLLVAVILTYLRKSGQRWLTSAVYLAIALGLALSAGLGYVLNHGVDEAVLLNTFGQTMGSYVSQFLGNEALREGVLGVIAIVMVGTLVFTCGGRDPSFRKDADAAGKYVIR